MPEGGSDAASGAAPEASAAPGVSGARDASAALAGAEGPAGSASETGSEGVADLAASAAPATAYALALLGALAREGVTDVVVCPGSRSQALALAASALDAEGLLRVHVRIDERSAAFFALGLGIETGSPAAVITTSGSAVAHLHPAVLEAHHSRVPLILLTADRPAELRGIRSNQTTVQPGIFGGAVRFERDVAAPEGGVQDAARAQLLAREAVRSARGRLAAGAGPVHLNVAFREPLSSALAPEQLRAALSAEDVPENAHSGSRAGASEECVLELGTSESRAALSAEEPPEAAHSGTRSPVSVRFELPTAVLERGPRTVVIAGHAAGPDAEELAHAGSWPLIAEVVSGARYGRNLVVPYRRLLRDAALGGRIERAVVFGHPTLSREVPALLQRDDVEVLVVDPAGTEFYNPGRRARRVAAASVSEGPADREWLGQWIVASRELVSAADRDTAPSLEDGHSHDPQARLRYTRAEFDAVRAPVDRRMLAEELWRATWPHDRLVMAASRLIREADAVVGGKKIPVHANRGLAGIDGTIATAHGIAAAQQRDGQPGVTRVLIGDLALLHDAGSMLGGHDEAWPRLQLVVGNDRGGSIFDGLEVAATADRDAFDRVQYTPHDIDLAALATAYRWEYVRATNRGELEQALTMPRSAPVLIEVPLER